MFPDSKAARTVLVCAACVGSWLATEATAGEGKLRASKYTSREKPQAILWQKELRTELARLLKIEEQLENEASELENLCAGEKKLLDEQNSEVEKAVKKINTRKKSVTGRRDALAPELRPATLKRYNMLRTKRNGSAVVQTVNGVCQGCFMTIPPQQYNEVRKGDKLNYCPTCQRILYFREEETESADA